MTAKWIDLFQGLMQEKIPFGSGGYIVNVRFSDESNYTIFETIGFKNVKNIYQSDDSVTFQSDGYKIYFLFEPRTYPRKHLEPYLRDDKEMIPLRWNELHTIKTPRKDLIYISKEPYISHGSFNIEIPAEGRFVYYLFESEQINENACEFISKVLSKDFQLSRLIIDDILVHYNKNLEFFDSATKDDY